MIFRPIDLIRIDIIFVLHFVRTNVCILPYTLRRHYECKYHVRQTVSVTALAKGLAEPRAEYFTRPHNLITRKLFFSFKQTKSNFRTLSFSKYKKTTYNVMTFFSHHTNEITPPPHHWSESKNRRLACPPLYVCVFFFFNCLRKRRFLTIIIYIHIINLIDTPNGNSYRFLIFIIIDWKYLFYLYYTFFFNIFLTFILRNYIVCYKVNICVNLI